MSKASYRLFELVQVHECEKYAEVIIRDKNNVKVYAGQIQLVDNPESYYPALTDEQVNDLIDEWHDGDSDLELHEYLGMSLEEYKKFVEGSITYEE